jgi:DNA (cytosine-5)-methyltransferase 1
MNSNLLLSLFPGAGLLDKAFEMEGFCVVRGPDLIYGGDVRRFYPVSGVFGGIIGGPPCQEFSRLFRGQSTGYSDAMVLEYIRIVTAAGPEWFLMENVIGVPDIQVPGYTMQRIHLCNSECGGKSSRLRVFQYGHRRGKVLVIDRGEKTLGLSRVALASEGKRAGRRPWREFCAAQGLPEGYDLPGLTLGAKYKAVGNGVPLDMGRVMARACQSPVDVNAVRLCVCQCGRKLPNGRILATAACRQRMKRRRDAAGVTGPGPVTAAASQIELLAIN